MELVRVLITIAITLWTAFVMWWTVGEIFNSDSWLSFSMWSAILTCVISCAAWAMWYRRGMLGPP